MSVPAPVLAHSLMSSSGRHTIDSAPLWVLAYSFFINLIPQTEFGNNIVLLSLWVFRSCSKTIDWLALSAFSDSILDVAMNDRPNGLQLERQISRLV